MKTLSLLTLLVTLAFAPSVIASDLDGVRCSDVDCAGVTPPEISLSGPNGNRYNTPSYTGTALSVAGIDGVRCETPDCMQAGLTVAGIDGVRCDTPDCSYSIFGGLSSRFQSWTQTSVVGAAVGRIWTGFTSRWL